MKTEWNYSDLAKSYVSRPNYSEQALNDLFNKIDLGTEKKEHVVCDVGAGVAHLTIPLLNRNFFVHAVEPNDEMRALGKERTAQFDQVIWSEGTGEDTRQSSDFFDVVTFGSSFNVTDRVAALKETVRILKDRGWFVCMWNHRDLNDPIQKDVEEIIQKHIPNYDYGTRREDQTAIINTSNLFCSVNYLEGSVNYQVEKKVWLDAWKSHATLARQAGVKFHQIIGEIENYLEKIPTSTLSILYTTRIWYAQKK